MKSSRDQFPITFQRTRSGSYFCQKCLAYSAVDSGDEKVAMSPGITLTKPFYHDMGFSDLGLGLTVGKKLSTCDTLSEALKGIDEPDGYIIYEPGRIYP